jgi:hydrogenase expression/formation protein HypC
MCLGIPAKIVELYLKDGVRMGKVDFGGVFREVCFEMLPAVQVNQYAIVHVGFAISLLNEENALESLRLLADLEAEDSATENA